MVKRKDYIPSDESKLGPFLDNFHTKLATYATVLGFTSTEVNAIKTADLAASSSITAANNARISAQTATAEKNTLVKTAIEGVRKAAGSIKKNKNYTETIGRDLGIIGEDSIWDPSTAQPVLKLRTDGGHVLVDFDKVQSNGIKLWGRRGKEVEFSFLAQDTQPPYYDNRPNLVIGVPEKREYFAYYILRDDEPVGQQSLPVSITV